MNRIRQVRYFSQVLSLAHWALLVWMVFVLAGCKRGKCDACAKDDDCDTGLACTALKVCKAPDDPKFACTVDCTATEECMENGRCDLRGGQCVAGTPDRCLQSAGCREFGWCSLGEYGLCGITGDSDCAKSDLYCRQRGLCAAAKSENRWYCVAKTDAGCKASDLCRTAERCAAVNGECGFNDESCRKGSNASFCKSYGQCSAVDGGCGVRSSDDCKNSDGCLHDGECTAVLNSEGRRLQCEIGSDEDCRKSSWCKEDNRCHFKQSIYGSPGHGDCVK